MKLLSVEIANFMAIGHAKVALADRGLCLIQGENQDESSATSNGAGKSSFADSLSFCFFGTTARGEEGDRVVNRFVGKNCSVSIDLEDGSDTYRITRYRKHGIHKNALRVLKMDPSAAWVDLTKGTDALTQKMVNQIIGCSYDVFIGAIYCGQGIMPDLPGMTDKNLKMLIEEASGATLLESAYNEAQTRLRTAKAQVDAVATRVNTETNAVNVAATSLLDAQAGETKFEEDRLASVKIIHAKAIVTKSEIADMKIKFAADDPNTLRVGIKGFDIAIAAVTGEREEEKIKSAELVAAQHLLARHDVSVETLAATLKKETASLAAVEHQIGCPCDTCARPYTAAEIAPAKKIAEARVLAAESALSKAKSQRGALLSRVVALTDALEKHRATMTDVSATNAMRADLDAKLRVALANESALKSKIEALNSFVEQIKAKRAEINPFIHRIATCQKALTFAESALKGFESDLELVTAALKVAETVVKVFSPSGVRAFLLDEVTPFLNDQTAKYLGTLSDGHIQATWTTLVKTGKGELREKFSIEVSNSTGGETFKGISGGEKRKVRIACALALQDLVARRATKPIDLFLADEVDDALDQAGLERLADVLQEKAKERGSVFVISHSDIKDWFSQIITVKKVGGISVIEDVVTA